MADVTKNDKGEIESIRYTDFAGYSLDVEAPGENGRLRITTKSKSGTGSPVDLERDEAKRFARDVIDLAGGGDD